MKHGTLQRCILSLLFFYIHLCELFYFLGDLDIASYVDDTRIYVIRENKESVINTLDASSLPLFTWFNNNFMKANKNKSQLLLICS